MAALPMRVTRDRWSDKTRRLLCVLYLGAAIVANPGTVRAVDYTFSIKTTDPVVATEILGQTTTGYFIGSSKKSTTFANTWSVVVTAKNPNAPGKCPPDFVSGAELLKALVDLSSSTYPYGYAAGMEWERNDNVQTLYGMQGYDFAKKTIGGKSVTGGYTIPELVGSTIPVAGFERKYVSTDTVYIECLGMYNAAVSTITVKDFGPPPLIPGF